MKIIETYSHLNGQEYLLVRRPLLWQEVQEAIEAIDAQVCCNEVGAKARMQGERKKYNPVELNKQLTVQLDRLGWTENQKQQIEAASGQTIYSYNQTDFVKDRVAIEVQFGKYAFVAYDLFVKHLAFYVRDEIDVGIEILPMKALQADMSSGPGYYEGELYNVIRNGRGVPAVPLVMIGIAP